MSIEKLVADHAYWADRVRQLKELGEVAAGSCSRRQPPADCDLTTRMRMLNATNCIDEAYGSFKAGTDPMYGGPSFEEVWDAMVVEGDVCLACQNVRRYKADRMNARRRLGAIRAAITRVGRRINIEPPAGREVVDG